MNEPCLHSGGGAASPAVVLVDQASHAEGAPRLVHVAVQVADCHDAGDGWEHCRAHLGLQHVTLA
jgi:hypothetical protein